VEEYKKNHPIISVGMPVFNGEKSISAAVNSILRQTHTDFELIISDNASNDNTEKICRELADSDIRITYIRQAINIGPTKNFEFVLKQANGKFFMWAASDDTRDAFFLELALKVIEQDPKVGLVFSDLRTVDLISGESQRTEIGFSVSEKKINRYIYRIKNERPALIYGLQRIDLLKKVKIVNFDYFDVYLSHFYELESKIKIIPIELYFSGTYGKRIPYSMTGKLIQIKGFLYAELALLNKFFNPFLAFLIWVGVVFIYTKRKNVINKVIAQHTHE
jgi:glycosyltransferase involved in cell wall biosynthesis